MDAIMVVVRVSFGDQCLAETGEGEVGIVW
jgi:hypothetical protein